LRGNVDILIDILVGRRSDDIRTLDSILRQNFRQSLTSVVSRFITDSDVSAAMEIVLEMDRPDNNQPVNLDQLVEDLLIIEAFDPGVKWYQIFLRRNDDHLVSLNYHFQRTKGESLDGFIQGYATHTKTWQFGLLDCIGIHNIRNKSYQPLGELHGMSIDERLEGATYFYSHCWRQCF
jgi:hypothetical protein